MSGLVFYRPKAKSICEDCNEAYWVFLLDTMTILVGKKIDFEQPYRRYHRMVELVSVRLNVVVYLPVGRKEHLLLQ